VLKRFTRASFTDAFQIRVRPAHHMGGTPVDPGVFYSDGLSAMVFQCCVRLRLQRRGHPWPVKLLVGAYEWDDAARWPPSRVRQHAAQLQLAQCRPPWTRSRPPRAHLLYGRCRVERCAVRERGLYANSLGEFMQRV